MQIESLNNHIEIILGVLERQFANSGCFQSTAGRNPGGSIGPIVIGLLLCFGVVIDQGLAFSHRAIPEEKIPTLTDGLALSDRIASYQIEVRLDKQTKVLEGYEILTWRNESGQPLDEFCFHLYLNAFKNNRSLFVREGDFESLWDDRDEIPESYWGYTRIRSIEVLGSEILQPKVVTAEYRQSDDSEWDETVLMVGLDSPLPPGGVIRFRIEFNSKLPRGVARTGWAEDYYLVAQWFPKIGVFQEGGWNCHHYHRVTEYFSDYGVYDVTFTVPRRFVVGATGKQLQRRDNPDGTTTYRYYQEDVHDFAWAASPRFLKRKRRFTHASLPEVEITLLLLPEHRHLEDRYFTAARNALRYFGEWFGPYPYQTLTIVDPAYGSDSGGMEYPTFVTGRAHFWTPQKVLSPEGVTVHEVGHQWWYGLVANNEFEESWLDEGITSWSASRVERQVYEPRRYFKRFFGGIPFVFDSVPIPFETSGLPDIRKSGTLDLLVRPGWKYLNRKSYRVNSYDKPEVTLWTLERLLGEDLMLEVMRTYFQRYRFKHPTTEDFIRTVDEVTKRDHRWFFEQTFFSAEWVDYAVVTATSKPIPSREGIFDKNDSSTYVSPSEGDETEKTYLNEVVVRRLGGARFPVEIAMLFENGLKIRKHWDGKDPWRRYQVEKGVRLTFAEVDPKGKILLDIDPTNNSRWVKHEKDPGFSLAAKKWASRWLFWFQNLLESFAFVG